MNRPTHKTLDCKICGEEVKNVGHDADKVTCSICVQKSLQTGILPSEEYDMANECDD